MSGTDDQRMKDLADRLVAMSPEPPPFPEEHIVTQPTNGSKKQSPVLIFVGAAAIVLILAAIPILLLRGGGEVAPIGTTTTSTVPSTETTEPVVSSTTTTLPATTTSTVPVTETQGVVVFLVQTPENSFLGNPALTPFFAIAEARPGDPEVLSALRLLTADDLTPPSGFQSMIPDAVEVVGVTRSPSDQLITVDMNQAFLDGAGGLLADFTMLNQLIFTAGDGEEISEVLFTVDGEPVTAFGSEGLDLSQPLGRDAFLDQLNSVNLDSAVTGTGDSPLVISGFANVFEATVSLELVDPAGSVVYEAFTTATCGTGCWGAFTFNIDDFDFAATPVTVRVFFHSPEDGEPADVVSVPVAWGDDATWDLTGS